MPRFLIQLLMFSLPFVVGLGAARWITSESTRPFESVDFAVEPVDTVFDSTNGRKLAVLLVGDDGVEATTVLTTYGLLAAAETFDVITVSPGGRAAPISFGLHVLPNLSLSEYDRTVRRNADLVVIPDLENASEKKLVDWVRLQRSDSTWFLSIGRGGGLLAEAGILDDSQATYQTSSKQSFDQVYPSVTWTRDSRWTESGMIVTSATGAAAIDATLRVISLIDGNQAATKSAQQFSYPTNPGSGFDEQHDPTLRHRIARYLIAGFVWDKRDVGVTLFDGVDEFDLAAIVGVYPFVFDADVATIGIKQGVFETSHGLRLIPVLNLGDEPKLHELVVPGAPGESDLELIRSWAMREEIPAFNPFGGPATDKFAYDATLEGIAASRGAAVAEAVGQSVGHPVTRIDLDQYFSWPYDVIMVPVAFGLLSVFIFGIATKSRIPKRTD